MSIKTSIRALGLTLERESPTILTALGVTGLVTTVVMAVSATPKALKILDKADYDRVAPEGKLGKELTPIEVVELTWMCYAPAALVGLVTAMCIVGSNSVNLRRNAALASLYSLTERALREYQEKVIETIGEKKEQHIRDEIAQDKLNSNPVGNIVVASGKVLMFDSLSGRYFQNDMESVRRIVNDFNEMLFGSMYASLNELYDELGLEGTTMGQSVGYSVERGLLRPEFSAKIATNGEPCIVVDFKPSPKAL